MALFTIIAALGLGALILKFIFDYLTSTKSNSSNPFAQDCRIPLKPKVRDQKERDKVLKESFNIDAVPSNLDAIVIGSGIGGLTTAAILAKAGKRVLVLEQHDQAGGCCHTYIEKGYEFDIGIHYIGRMSFQSTSKTLLDQISFGQIEWADLREDFDQVVFMEKDAPIRQYPVYSDKKKWIKYLKNAFPEETSNIDKYFELVEKVNNSAKSAFIVKVLPLWLVKILEFLGIFNFFTYWKWNSKTVGEVICETTKNEDLRDIFCYCFGDYGTRPGKAGFQMQAILLAHYMGGAAYPVGGASEIPFNIIPIIRSNGGKVLVRANVEKILLDGNSVCGVRVKKGSELHNIFAPVIVSSAGVFNTFGKLLPSDVAAKSNLWPLVKSNYSSHGAIYAFVGINRPFEELDKDIQRTNFWVYGKNNIDKVASQLENASLDELMDSSLPFCFISFPSTKDPEFSKRFPGKTTLVIITLMRFELFKKWEKERATKRGDEYESIKNMIGLKLIDVATNLFPSIKHLLKDYIDYVSVGTPLSQQYYLGAPQGETYGLDHAKERFYPSWMAKLRPKSDIKGLYLTGQDTMTCGFVSGLWSGLLTGMAVLDRNVFLDLSALHKQIKTELKAKKE